MKVITFETIIQQLDYKYCQALEQLDIPASQINSFPMPELELLIELGLCCFKQNNYGISKQGKSFLQELFENDYKSNNSGRKYELFLKKKTLAHKHSFESGVIIQESNQSLTKYNNQLDYKSKNFVSDGIIDSSIIIEAKFQSSIGTAEEKIADKIFRIGKIMLENPGYQKAYIVFGGKGWSPYTILRSREIKDSFKNICELDIFSISDQDFCHLLTTNSI